MIGTLTPAARALYIRPAHAKAAYIDAVEAQQRQQCRVTERRPAAVGLEHFMHVERVRKLVCCAMAPVPVVKIARHHQRRIGGYHALDALAQVFELAAARTRGERQMYAYAMQRFLPTRNLDLAMQ